MEGGSRWCALREAWSRALPPGLAEALKPGHAGDLCFGDICPCSVHSKGSAMQKQLLCQSACLTVES